jgi:hypothetical protein
MQESLFGKANRVLTTKILAGIGGLLAAFLSFTMSVYQSRTAGQVPQVDPGTAIDAGRWSITVRSARTARQMPDGSHVPPGKQVLVIDLLLENRSAESSNLYGDALKIENISVAPKPLFYLTRDRALLWDAQPMMPERVAAVWQVVQDEPLPAKVKLSVVGSIFKPRDNLYAAPGWFPTMPVAIVDVALSKGDGAGQ